MGGKKGPEKSRKYEKDRRNRFNDQFAELHKLLPDINSSIKKVTKAEIISRAIQYLKDSQSRNRTLENEFENEKTKISELQKKVTGLLQIVNELVKLLHKSNIKFPASCPVDDFKSFRKTYLQCKEKSKLSSTKGDIKKRKALTECSDSASDTDSVDESDCKNAAQESQSERYSPQMTVSAPSVTSMSAATNTSGVQVVNTELPNMVKLNSNSLILPQGNLVAVNELQNAVNSSPVLLLNKQMTVPTLILMQNNVVPISATQNVTIQRSQKIIMPKQMVNTKTTFINKKPIPAVRLFKSQIAPKEGLRSCMVPKRKRSRRSKGILVKYPKRKPPSKSKKQDVRLQKSKSPQPAKIVEPAIDKSELRDAEVCKTSNKNECTSVTVDEIKNSNELPDVQQCTSKENHFNSTEDAGKSYSCSDNIFDTDIPTTGQFIDFFENNTTRCLDNGNEGSVDTTQFQENGEDTGEKEKERVDNFNSTPFERSFSDTTVNCALESTQKEETEETQAQGGKNDKNLGYLPATRNDSMLLMSNDLVNTCPVNVSSVERSEPSSSTVPDKCKSGNKDPSTPLTVHCSVVENKSGSKDLNLSLMDDKKHYESSFDEFPNDLFTSLHVPASGQSTDSISPTAAFLQTFPLVSSGANVDLLPEHEDDSNATATTSTTILQIGNLESPSTLLFTANKLSSRDTSTKTNEKLDDTYSSYCMPALDKEKKDTCKETTSTFNFNELSFNSQLKSACPKESQNVPFYAASAAASFPSYNMFPKYNDIPAVTASYHSLPSQPFPTTKATESDFNSWMPSIYGQDDTTKERGVKRSSTFKNVADFSLQQELGDRVKTKKSKQNNVRPLVNWMTTPDQRSSDTSQPVDPFVLPKDDSMNTFLSSTATVQNNTNFNVSYSTSDYFLDNQNYSDGQLSSCKIAYTSAANNYSWSPPKSTLPSLPLDSHIIPSTLPTLVGDLALGTTPTTTYNNFDFASKKYSETTEKKKNTCKNYYKSTPQNSSSFLSVTQLVEDKGEGKLSSTSDKKNILENCHYDADRDKCYRDAYPLMNKASPNACKDTGQTLKVPIKSKKDAVKYNMGPRCPSKENKKDSRQHQQQKSFNDYSLQTCRNAPHKEVNPLTNKNSNYSAESLIGSSSHQNACPTQNYFSYDNSNYGNCSNNEYSKKRIDDVDPLTSVGYYPNSNYYHNNFQTFNNYGFSNQCYNNYPAQIQHSSFQKKKEENYPSKTDVNWYKEGLPAYNTMLPADFGSGQKSDAKCKQPYSNKFQNIQKNSIQSSSYDKFYPCGSATLSHSKSSCTFNSTCSFNQAGQQCSEVNCLASSYEMKSNRNGTAVNSNVVHPATTLTNFNLSTIFPEINDKHCVQNRVNAVGNEKNDTKYSNKVAGLDEMNYNYLVQPNAENHSDAAGVYGQSTFHIQHFTDFTSRKTHK